MFRIKQSLDLLHSFLATQQSLLNHLLIHFRFRCFKPVARPRVLLSRFRSSFGESIG